MYGCAVIHHLQVTLLEVHDPLAVGALDVGIPDIPLLRYGPVKDRGAAWHLEGLKRNTASDHRQSAPDSVTCDAAADRIQLARKSVQFPADFGGIALIKCFQQAHSVS